MRFTATFLAGLAALLIAGSAQAEFVLQLPLGAKETYSKIETALDRRVPVGPFDGQIIPTEKGPDIIRRSAWAFGGEQTIADVQKNILGQLKSSDYEILLFCQTAECGGFDFRFGINVLREPEMRVDLRDFRFISARQMVSEKPAYVTFLISKSPVSVYVQMTEYAPSESRLPTPVQEQVQTAPQVAEPQIPKAAEAPEFGLPTVLEGLTFKTGSSKISADPNNTIADLAALLNKDETLKVLLVGHSDMTGALKANLSLSRRRAKTVAKVLVSKYGISRKRLSAEGIGYLSPRASNETKDGKKRNRRIEVVLYH